MKNLPPKYTLPIKPKEYFVQGLSHCGAYSIKAILSAFGKDDRAHPEDYHSDLFNRLTGLTSGKDYWPQILSKFGIKAELKSAKDQSDLEKIELLKMVLSKNAPVMLRIGNGYFRSKKYNPILGKIMGHWITLWGYDDKERVFYVYDSGLTKELYDNVPIGNTKRTYNEILRDWRFGTWQFWTWYVSTKKYVYLEIKKS